MKHVGFLLTDARVAETFNEMKRMEVVYKLSLFEWYIRAEEATSNQNNANVPNVLEEQLKKEFGEQFCNHFKENHKSTTLEQKLADLTVSENEKYCILGPNQLKVKIPKNLSSEYPDGKQEENQQLKEDKKDLSESESDAFKNEKEFPWWMIQFGVLSQQLETLNKEFIVSTKKVMILVYLNFKGAPDFLVSNQAKQLFGSLAALFGAVLRKFASTDSVFASHIRHYLQKYESIPCNILETPLFLGSVDAICKLLVEVDVKESDMI